MGSRIINYYLPEQEMAVFINLRASCQSDLERVEKVTMEVAKQILQEIEGGVKKFEPFMRYSSFGESGINFTVILRAKEYTDQYLIVHEFIKRLQRRYQVEGIEIPSSVRMVYSDNGILKG